MNHKTFLLVVLSLVLTVLSACTTSSTPNPGPQPSTKFDLSITPDKVIIFQGDKARFTVKLTRKAGFTGAVSLTLANLPTGVSATSATIATSATSAEIELSAPDSVSHSLPTTVTVEGVSGLESNSKTFTVTVRGEAGELDTSFNGGANIVPVGPIDDYAEAIAVQSDGKILVAGCGYVTGGGIGIALVRFNRDGRLLVAGQIMNDFALVRLTVNGQLDSSFENSGAVITKVSTTNWDVAESMVVQADGKIVLGGWMYDASSQGNFALVRYNQNGSLDAGFGDSGKAITAVAPGTKNDQGRAVALQVDERVITTRVLLAGSVSVSGHDFGLLRFWQ